MGGTASGVTYRSVLGVSEFRAVFGAELLSVAGDQVAAVSLAVLVFDRSSSPLLAALAYALTFLPWLVVAPLLGLLADTRPRRSTMIWCDLLRAVAVGLMALPWLPVPVLFGLLFAAAAFAPPFESARAALLPDILPGQRYPVGQALATTGYQLSSVAGFAAGGLLVSALSPRTGLALDAATFLLSAGLLLRGVAARPAVSAPATTVRDWAVASAQGARLIFVTPQLRRLVTLGVIGAALAVVPEGLAVAYAAQHGHAATATGLLTAALPAGVVVGSLALARWVPPQHRDRLLRPMTLLAAAPLAATVLEPPVPVAIGLWAVAGVGCAFQLTANATFAAAVPAPMRGRAFAFAQAGLQTAQGLALLAAGAAATLTSAGVVVGAVGALALGAFVAVTPTRPRVYPAAQRWLRRLPASAAVWLLIGTVTGLSTLLWLTVGEDLGPGPLQAEHPLHWWLLAPVFTLTISFLVHFQTRGESRSIALCQLPLVLGLYFCTPVGLVLARVLGPLPFLIGVRRQSPVKLGLNLAVFGLEATVAVSVFHATWPGSGHPSTFAWVATLLAVLAADVGSFVAVAVAIALTERRFAVRETVRPLTFAVGTSVLNTCLALLAVAALSQDPTSSLLIALVAALVVLGFRAYANLLERDAGLGQLVRFQETLTPLTFRGDDLYPALEHTRRLLMAEQVELTLTDGSGDGATQLLLRADGFRERRHLRPAIGSDHAAGDVAVVSGPLEQIVVPLQVGGRTIGSLAVRHRQGDIRAFNGSDVKLLETLASLVSAALEKGTLLERLQEAATRDSLTGLLSLGEACRLTDERLVRSTPLTVVLIDITRLQDVNDSLGHAAGDAVLRVVADRLCLAVPDGALVARTGGDEFATVLPGPASPEAASATAVRISHSVGQLMEVAGVTVDVRLRIGISQSPPDGHDAGTLLRRAELALASTRRSSATIARYQPEMERQSARRLRLGSDLRPALEGRDLAVMFQPLVRTSDGIVVGAEALVRWDHPVYGPVDPTELIPLAERCGQIDALTNMVLDRSLQQAAAWAASGHPLRVSVNLSARCLQDLSLPSRVLDRLAAHRVLPERLTLEITESIVAEEPARALGVLAQLRAIGVRLSIDDFGTGYSSLAYLTSFPVQEVKLDRSFITVMERNGDPTLVRAIVALAHGLGLEVVAEGVEDCSVLDRLTGLGVDLVQGYYLGHPRLAADWDAWPAGQSAARLT